MVKWWQKRVQSYGKPTKIALLSIIDDIKNWNHKNYDIIPMQGYIWWFRLRKWKFRIIFSKHENEYIIESIDTRWDIYKSL